MLETLQTQRVLCGRSKSEAGGSICWVILRSLTSFFWLLRFLTLLGHMPHMHTFCWWYSTEKANLIGLIEVLTVKTTVEDRKDSLQKTPCHTTLRISSRKGLNRTTNSPETKWLSILGNQIVLEAIEPVRVDLYGFVWMYVFFNYLIFDVFIVLLVLVEMQNATQRCVHLMSKCRCSYSFIRWLVLKAWSKPMSFSEVEISSIFNHRMLRLPEKK